MDARDADVAEAIDRVAHDLGGDRGFLGDVEIGCPGAGDDDRSLALLDLAAAERDGARVDVILRRRRHLAHRLERLGLRARDEQRPSARDNPRRDGGDLGRSLPKAEYHFGKPLAQLAMCINARKAQVLERRLAHRGGNPLGGGSRVNRAGPYGVEQFLEVQAGHEAVW